MKIAIVGGGTAGWLAALFLLRSQPNKHSVTLIESSSIGIIGAGEGSTGLLLDLLSNQWFDTGANVLDFIKYTNGTRKLGIRHINWTGDGSSYFAPLDGSPTSDSNPDFDFLSVLSNFGKDKMHVASSIGQFYENSEYPPGGGALHFDAHLIGKYIHSILKNEKLEVLDDIVEEVSVLSNGDIEKVVLASGKEVYADFFFDSTGFSRVLAKRLDMGWKSYRENLPVDRAMPFLTDIRVNQEPLTTAHALSSGWMWGIPLQNRVGCGYVYSSEFITDELAKIEVEKTVGFEIDPIKIIKFSSGRSEIFWKNNCIVIGLASAFSEPLEATSIHTTIVQLLVFSFEFLTESKHTTISETSIKRYNKRIEKLYDDIRDFLVIHYQGGRVDSDFWRMISSGVTLTPFSREILEKTEHKIPGVFQFDYYYGSVGAPLWNWVLAGIDKITPEKAKKELLMYTKN